MNRTPNEQFVSFLSDMYTVEQQALSQLKPAPAIAGDAELAAAIEQHTIETEIHAELIGERLDAHGVKPSAIKEAIMKLGGKAFALFAAAMPETPGRLVAHAYSYEAMEWAGYEMLARFAEQAGDTKTVEVARQIGSQERRMMQRLEQAFDIAEGASHRDTPAENMPADIRKHLNEAHALESQAVTLLSKSRNIAGDPELAQTCQRNLEAARQHAAQLEQRLGALGTSVSTFKDAALGMMGMNWGFFFQAHSDTPAKLAAFAYAFEHLKIAGYELLLRSARRADDMDTQHLCETLLADEHTMVKRVASTFDSAAQATLATVGDK